jgi:hypothetical protein
LIKDSMHFKPSFHALWHTREVDVELRTALDLGSAAAGDRIRRGGFQQASARQDLALLCLPPPFGSRLTAGTNGR